MVVNNEKIPTEHGNKLRDYERQMSEVCIGFMQSLMNDLAEGLPTGFKLELNKKVYIFYFYFFKFSKMLKNDLYCIIVEELKEKETPLDDIPCPETFLYIWRTHYKNITIPRHNTLGSCGTCLLHKKHLNKFQKGTCEYRNTKRNFSLHLTQVREERTLQIQRDSNASLFPHQT